MRAKSIGLAWVALFAFVCICIGAPDKKTDGWTKKVTNYTVERSGGSIFYASTPTPSTVIYQYFSDHKLVSYIREEDGVYSLYDWKDVLIAKYDELGAAKDTGAMLSVLLPPCSNSGTIFGATTTEAK